MAYTDDERDAQMMAHLCERYTDFFEHSLMVEDGELVLIRVDKSEIHHDESFTRYTGINKIMGKFAKSFNFNCDVISREKISEYDFVNEWCPFVKETFFMLSRDATDLLNPSVYQKRRELFWQCWTEQAEFVTREAQELINMTQPMVKSAKKV